MKSATKTIRTQYFGLTTERRKVRFERARGVRTLQWKSILLT